VPISVQCTSCGKKFNAADKFAGRRVKCPGCQVPIDIPAAEGQAVDEGSGQGQWHMMTEDGSEYGPITREELDSWLEQGRIDETCQVLCDGWEQWKWAIEVFPSLSEPEPAAQAPAPVAATPEPAAAPSAFEASPAPGPMTAQVPQPQAQAPGPGPVGASTMNLPGRSSNNTFMDILTFKKGIAEIGIQILFWFACFHFVWGGIEIVIEAMDASFLKWWPRTRAIGWGLSMAIIGPIFARVCAEVTTLFYRMYEELIAIRKK